MSTTLATDPRSVAVTTLVMATAMAERIHRNVDDLRAAVREAAPWLAARQSDQVVDPLYGIRHPIEIIAGDLRLLDVQTRCDLDDLERALAGEAHQLGVRTAIRALHRMGDLRRAHLRQLKRVVPSVSAQLEVAIGSKALGRQLRDAVDALHRSEEHASIVRADISRVGDSV